jgi:hypothetical protein
LSGELCRTLGSEKRVEVRETCWVGSRYSRVESRGGEAGNACLVSAETSTGCKKAGVLLRSELCCEKWRWG